jgi:ubiquinone/menaquinone biosynthesis C-methylase UbiE
MTEDEVKKHFDLNAKDYNEKIGTDDHRMMHYGDHSEYERNILEQILAKLGLASKKEIEEAIVHRTEVLAEKAGITDDDVVVDSGCGRGGNALWIADNTGAKVIGLDINEELIKQARENAEAEGLSDRIEFVVGNFDDMPLDDFDVYFAIESQCYSEDEEKLANNIYESMNEGGRLIISDGFRTKEFSEEEEEISDKMHKGWGVDYMATRDNFKKYLEEAGFTNIEVEDIKDQISTFAVFLHRISVLSTPYVDARIYMASTAEKLASATPFGKKDRHTGSRERYEQVRDLLTTGRWQALAAKKGIFTQYDFYAEKEAE